MSGSTSRLQNLLQYRYNPKKDELPSQGVTTPTKQPGATCIPDTPEAKRPISSPVSVSRQGVLGRRGVVMIDSDEDACSPVKTPQKSPLNHVQYKPSPGSHNEYRQYNQTASRPQTSPYRSPSLQSQSSSPWLSKALGQQQHNGHSPGFSRSPQSTSGSSWTGSQGSSFSSQLSPTSHSKFQGAMAHMRSMFPQETNEKLETALRHTNLEIEAAIDYVISSINKTPQKRQYSNVSSPASSPVEMPKSYKRIRLMSDSSTEGDGSQTELTEEQKVSELHEKFPNYKREVLRNILKQYNGSIDSAMTAITRFTEQQKQAKSPTSPTAGQNMGSIKAFQAARQISKAFQASSAVDVSDGEDGDVRVVARGGKSKSGPGNRLKGAFYDPRNVKNRYANGTTYVKSRPVRGTPHKMVSNRRVGLMTRGTKRQTGEGGSLMSLEDDYKEDDEDYDSEYDSEEDDDPSSGEPILDFFNTAQIDELNTINGCSKKKADIIMASRPFESWQDLAEKFHEAKLINLIGNCKTLLKDRKAIDDLMTTCERLSKQLDAIVKYLTRSTELDNDPEHTHITKQPDGLNRDFQLKPFQMVGLNWLVLMHSQELNGILADEMGLGKTIQTIAFLTQLLEDGEKGPHVIVAPSSTLDNWLRELVRWSPGLKVMMYYGSQEERKDLRAEILQSEGGSGFNVLVTTYNIATGSLEDRALLKKVKFTYAVFDEGHMLKNMSSLRYKNLWKIRAKRRLLLTGTPLQNNLIELMSLLQFVMPELFADKQDQLKIFTSVSNKSHDARSKYEQRMIGRAKNIMKPFYLRRLKKQVLTQMPKKTVQVEHVALNTDQREIYDELKARFSREMADQSAQRKGGANMLMELRKASNHHLLIRRKYDDKRLRQMSKLMIKEPTHCQADHELIFEDMQVMNDFELHRLCGQYNSIRRFQLDESDILNSGKFQFLQEILPKKKQEGHRVLLFSQFTMILDVLEILMKHMKYQYLRLDGQTAVADRQDLIDKFNTNEDIFMFLLSTKAGGLGINLTSADTVILHDIDFNPHNDLQAEDRCHRVGQTREVSVYKILSKGTVEEAMHRCAENKLNLEREVTGVGKGKNDEAESGDVASLLRESLQRD